MVFNLALADPEIIDKNMENIISTIHVENNKKALFMGYNNCSAISSYAEMFHDSEIDFWMYIDRNCIWENGPSEYKNDLESQIKNTRWRKVCVSYILDAYLHCTLVDDEGKITIVEKKDLIIFVFVGIGVLLAIIISLFFIGYYGQCRKTDYPSV